ncbi:MAG: ral secretory system protein domain protein [Myxococcales bacterium]|nr:ral secretory system protein domain protein [Myxococcales bacterium]
MPSRLSSLLVRDGLVGVKRMEKAFQRQVIYGGSLDTILLEMNLVPEERLTQYLALASGLPPASRDEGAQIQASAIELVPREISEQFRAVPLAVERDALRMLVCSPLEINELEDLADLLDRPLQPLICPEYRWHLVYATAYSLDPPARFTTLARQLEVDAAPTAVGRARSVIIEDGATRHSRATDPNLTVPLVTPPVLPVQQPARPAPAAHALAPVAADQQTMRVPAASEPIDQELVAPAEHVRNRRVTVMGVVPNPARTELVQPRRAADSIPPRATPASGVPQQFSDSKRSKQPSAPVVKAVRKAPQSAPIDTSGRDSPLAIVRAREMLAVAEDRDTVFLTLLRATRSRARYAGLLTVQGGAAIGRVALAETGIDTAAVQKVLIPLDSVSPFRTVVSNKQPHIGAIVSGDPGIDSMVLRLGGTMPPSALIMPISLRDRVVALVIAHRVHSDLKLVDITELLPLAGAAADALGRLIVRHKAAGYRSPATQPAVVEIEADLIDTKKLSRPEGEWRNPAPVAAPSVADLEDGTELSIVAEPPRPIDEVLSEIESSNEAGAEDAIADAVERSHEAVGVLMKRFPGKLRVERFAVTGRPLRAAQYGGLLELVVRLGSAASELLIETMSSPQRDVRFYATVCTAELRPRNAVFALVERVFDQDYGVRATAIEALSGYPLQDLSHALARARRAVHSTDPEVVAAAAAAIVELGDVDAVTDLIGALERSDRGSEHVRRALVALTAQDFGSSDRKWRKWWDGARNRHRIEWLIEGLGHKEDAIREAAINDLRRLTGEYFGYHHDLPRKEREAAAERWSSWWRETGQRRFEKHDDERNRPTGVLPGQPRD